MPFSNLDRAWSNLAQYYNTVDSSGVFIGGSTQKFQTPKTQYVSFDDGLIRGGVINATLASARDADRIGKFLLTGKGALFVAKQIGLQKSNIPLQQEKNDIGGFAFIDKVPTRTYNLGVNTLAQVPLNAFGGHIIRHGILPIGGGGFLKGDSYTNVKGYSYERAVLLNNSSNSSEDNRNRLIKYLGYLNGAIDPITNKRFNKNYSSNDTAPTILEQYNGGAASVYGIGKTFITTTTVKTDFKNLTFNNNFTGLTYKQLSSKNTQSSLGYISPTSSISSPSGDIDNIEIIYGVSHTGSKISRKVDAINAINVIGSDVFYDSNNLGSDISTVFSINYPKAVSKYNSLYATGSSPGSVDGKLNGKFGSDIIQFRIEFLNNDTPGTSNNINTDVLAFRAYIDDFNDGMSAKWDAYRYMGRGEEFYVYNGFTRDISVAFTIYAHSPEEMRPLYQKLNYLMSAFTPDYNDVGKMRGNIGYLTVGDYLYRQPGVFTDIKLSGMLDTHWEIGSLAESDDTLLTVGGYQLPKHVKVSLSFKPIHTFLPRRVSPKVNTKTSPPKFITPDEVTYPNRSAQGNGFFK